MTPTGSGRGSHEDRHPGGRSSAIRSIVLRNLAGWGCIVVGAILAMPFVPGPGTAFIVLGLALADWPGKRRFFGWLRSFRWFRRVEAAVRLRFGVRLPDRHGDEGSMRDRQHRG